MDLIPGLPDDVARQCLIRVPHQNFSTVSAVCRIWKNEIDHPDFFRQRKAAGHSRPVFALAQARVLPDLSSGALKGPKFAYRVTLLEPETGSWSELPPAPGFPDGLPMFCRLAGVGRELVVVGGWDPVTWEISRSVFVYSFVSATWRRGADMPGVRRSFFGCAGGRGRVFVAGGHDGEKNALRTALAYDVAKDEWVPLPEMGRERDECKGVFQGGKFQVIGGYSSEMQGRFGRSAEAFDFAASEWGHVEEEFFEAGTCPRNCVVAGEGDVEEEEEMYRCQGGELVVVVDGGSRSLGRRTWRRVAKMPAEMVHTAYMGAWGEGKVLAIGCTRFGEPHFAYILNHPTAGTGRWTKLTVPQEFSGHVQFGCHLEL